MRIAIVGASGFIGINLIRHVLETTDYSVVAIAKNTDSIDIQNDRLTIHKTNVFNADKLQDNLLGCDVAYFLVHMMAQHKVDYAVAEAKAAKVFSVAAKNAKVSRIIYLSGLGNDKDSLSKHLQSRHAAGAILGSIHPDVIEFRASMVIGRGSISFDIITNLIHKLPILTLPSWSRTRTQPISLRDVLSYLTAAIDIKNNGHKIIEIGAPSAVTYKHLMQLYAKAVNKKALMPIVPFIPVRVSGMWLNLFTPRRHAKVGRAMVESLANEMTVTNSDAQILFPDIKPVSVKKAIDLQINTF